MHVFDAKADLRKPVHNLAFTEVAPFLIRDKLSQISSISKVHHDTEMAFLRLVDLAECNDVWMVQYL